MYLSGGMSGEYVSVWVCVSSDAWDDQRGLRELTKRGHHGSPRNFCMLASEDATTKGKPSKSFKARVRLRAFADCFHNHVGPTVRGIHMGLAETAAQRIGNMNLRTGTGCGGLLQPPRVVIRI